MGHGGRSPHLAALERLAVTTLERVVAAEDLDDLTSYPGRVSFKVGSDLHAAALGLGVQVNSVEVRPLDPPAVR